MVEYATMPEPVTIAALALGALSWAASSAVGGHLGNITDRLSCNLGRAFHHRIAGLREMPENHDVARAVRIAQIQALERLIRDFRAVRPPEGAAASEVRLEAFIDRSLGFCAEAIGRSRDVRVRLSLDVSYLLEKAFRGILSEPVHDGPADLRSEALANFAESAVLDELKEQLDNIFLPDDFDAHFRKGCDEQHPRFLDLFSAYFVEQIKESPRLHAILTTGQLARIEGLAFDTAEMLYCMETHFSAALTEVETKMDALHQEVTSIEVTVREGFASTQSDLADIKTMLGQLLPETAGIYRIPQAAVDGLLRATLDRGLTDPEEIPGAFLEVARIFAQMRDRLTGPAGNGAEIATLKQQALDALNSGEFALVEQLWGKITDHHLEVITARKNDLEKLLPELLAARTDVAAACKEQAVAALLQSDLKGALEHIARGLSNLAEIPDGSVMCEACTDFAGDISLELYLFGVGTGGAEALSESVRFAGLALGYMPRDNDPFERAVAQFGMGNSLRALARFESGTRTLKRAIAAFHAALTELPRDRSPDEWVDIQQALALALYDLAGRSWLWFLPTKWERIANIYRELLKLLSPDEKPDDWIAAQNGLGLTLFVLAERRPRKKGKLLEQAVAAHRAALAVGKVSSQSQTVTLGYLAGALTELGGEKKGTGELEEAVAKHREALNGVSRERTPIKWAHAVNNLAVSLSALGLREKGVSRLHEAFMAHKEALEEFTSRGALHLEVISLSNIAHTLGEIGKRGNDAVCLDHAVDAYREAIELALDRRDWQGFARASSGLRRLQVFKIKKRVSAKFNSAASSLEH